MASLKLCLRSGGKTQIRRSRVESLEDFTYSALQKIAGDTFPGLTGREEFCYEDDEGEWVTLASDSDLAECVQVMDVLAKKVLRIEISGLDAQGARDSGVCAPTVGVPLREASPLSLPSLCGFCGEASPTPFCSPSCAAAASSSTLASLMPLVDAGPVGDSPRQGDALARLHTAFQTDSRLSLPLGGKAPTPPPFAEDGPIATTAPPRLHDTLPLLPLSAAEAHEPSVCIPWVSPEVGREVIISTFEQFGPVRHIDLVPREDHFLCFIHFERWRVEDPAISAVRGRLLHPPTPEHKESVEYSHPVTGTQRWLFSRSRVNPRAGAKPASEPTPSNPFGLGVVGISVPAGSGRLSTSSRVPSCPPPPTTTAFVPPHQPSLCVPWVRNNITRELLQDTFAPYGTVKQVDLVPKGDHYLCFIHFHSWKLEDPVACAVRARLLNPPVPDHKETIYYMHPTLGRQRWLFARSWVTPATDAHTHTPAATHRKPDTYTHTRFPSYPSVGSDPLAACHPEAGYGYGRPPEGGSFMMADWMRSPYQ